MTAEELAYWKRRGGLAPVVVTVHGSRPVDAKPLVPALMGFKARPADERGGHCAGCVFRTQDSTVCDEAARVAAAAGLPDCDDVDDETGRAYVYYVRDPRQRDLVVEFGIEGE